MKSSVTFLFLTLLSFAGLCQEGLVKIAKLNQGDMEGLEAIRQDFIQKNPGYDLSYHPEKQYLKAKEITQVVFVQDGGGTAIVKGEKEKSSKVAIGDIIMLKKGEHMEADSLMGLLVFEVPEKPSAELPNFIRPDWDPNITDEPGGCATETNAYRRILLTWKKEVGNYVYHAINAHRVRIMDSFSHYHPEEIGFEEFYLVQMVMPGAKLITSEKVDVLSDPENVKPEQVDSLFDEYGLEVGDLVYLPRGVMHRGLGGVLAQVITVPGFIPGSEYGVDHWIKQINEQLGLQGEEALPYNEGASDYQVIY